MQMMIPFPGVRINAGGLPRSRGPVAEASFEYLGVQAEGLLAHRYRARTQ